MAQVNQPLVSVIMPFFNTPANFLQEAVDSVLAQTYPAWELLLVDDGSTGDCVDLARRFAEQYPERMRYHHHPNRENRGPSAARNLGLERARGDLVAFLDADDFWFPQKLQEQIALLAAFPEAGLIYGATEYWFSWSGDPEDQALDHTPDLAVPFNRVLPPPLLVGRFLAGTAAVPCPCSLLVRREIMEQVGGFESDFRNIYEDQVFYVKIFLAAAAVVSGLCWDRYRQHPLSSSSAELRENTLIASRQAFLDWVARRLEAQAIDDPALWLILNEERWLIRPPVVGRVSAEGLRRLRWLKKWLLRAARAGLPAAWRRRLV